MEEMRAADVSLTWEVTSVLLLLCLPPHPIHVLHLPPPGPNWSPPDSPSVTPTHPADPQLHLLSRVLLGFAHFFPAPLCQLQCCLTNSPESQLPATSILSHGSAALPASAGLAHECAGRREALLHVFLPPRTREDRTCFSGDGRCIRNT